MKTISIKQFHSNDKGIILEYNNLRKNIFVDELGWNNVVVQDSNLLNDQYTDCSIYMAVVNNDIIGGLRFVPGECGFPYLSMIQHHFSNTKSKWNGNKIATITSMVLRKEYRGEPLYIDDDGKKISIAHGLFNEVFEYAKKTGFHIINANVSLTRAVYFFHKVGFYAIDPIFISKNHPFPILNMAIVVNSDRNNRVYRSQKKYIKSRHNSIVGSKPFNEFIKENK